MGLVEFGTRKEKDQFVGYSHNFRRYFVIEDQVIDRLEQILRYGILSPREAQKLGIPHKNNIEFGSHTCTHEILSKLKNEDAHYELLQSKKKIEEELKSEVNAFAYPNGQDEDFTEETKILLKKCGYKIAFTTLNGLNDATTDKFSIKRISAGDRFGDSFFSEVSGLNII